MTEKWEWRYNKFFQKEILLKRYLISVSSYIVKIWYEDKNTDQLIITLLFETILYERNDITWYNMILIYKFNYLSYFSW